MAQPPPLRPWVPLDLLHLELDAAIRIQQWRSRRTWRHEVGKLLSGHPLHDVSVVVPVTLLFTLPYAGYPLFWSAVCAYFLCFVTDKLVRAYTPKQLDARLVSLSQVSPHGFPCFELTLAAATFLSLSFVRDYPLFASLHGRRLRLHCTFVSPAIPCVRPHSLCADVPVPWRARVFTAAVSAAAGAEAVVHVLLPVQPVLQHGAGLRRGRVRAHRRAGVLPAPPRHIPLCQACHSCHWLPGVRHDCRVPSRGERCTGPPCPAPRLYVLPRPLFSASACVRALAQLRGSPLTMWLLRLLVWCLRAAEAVCDLTHWRACPSPVQLCE